MKIVASACVVLWPLTSRKVLRLAWIARTLRALAGPARTHPPVAPRPTRRIVQPTSAWAPLPIVPPPCSMLWDIHRAAHQRLACLCGGFHAVMCSTPVVSTSGSVLGGPAHCVVARCQSSKRCQGQRSLQRFLWSRAAGSCDARRTGMHVPSALQCAPAGAAVAAVLIN